jgi:hypothetical protein
MKLAAPVAAHLQQAAAAAAAAILWAQPLGVSPQHLMIQRVEALQCWRTGSDDDDGDDS